MVGLTMARFLLERFHVLLVDFSGPQEAVEYYNWLHVFFSKGFRVKFERAGLQIQVTGYQYWQLFVKHLCAIIDNNLRVLHEPLLVFSPLDTEVVGKLGLQDGLVLFL